jgi:hypothetical protein
MNHKINSILKIPIYMQNIVSNYLYPCDIFRIKEKKRMVLIRNKNINSSFIIINNIDNIDYINISSGSQLNIEWSLLINNKYINTYNCTIELINEIKTNDQLTSTTISLPLYIDTSNITNMSSMFKNNIFNGDISRWNTSNVQEMSEIFSENNIFNGDISRWDISNVQYMNGMFSKSIFNGDISRWNTSNVQDMNNIFYKSQINCNISKWNTSKVEHMANMFCKSQINCDISMWDTSNVIQMYKLFYKSQINSDISMWNTSNAYSMASMFCKSQINCDISMWDTSKVEHMYQMFYKSNINFEYIKNWIFKDDRAFYKRELVEPVEPDEPDESDEVYG